MIDFRKLRDRRVLITGASGFIGSHLVQRLVGQGVNILAFSRTPPRFLHERMRWRRVDLTDFSAARTAFQQARADVIFHLCSHAQGERDLHMVLPTFHGDLITTVNALTACTEIGFQRLVMAGSLEEPSPGDISSSPYAAAKAGSRAYARMFHQLYGAPIVMTRIFMVYGPGQATKKVLAHSIANLLRGLPLRIASPHRQVDWIYVDDVVDGLLSAALTPKLEGNSVDLGSGRLVEIAEAVRHLQQLTRSRSLVEFGTQSRGQEEVRCADVVRTRALIGWSPQITLEQGLRLTVDFQARLLARQAGNPDSIS